MMDISMIVLAQCLAVVKKQIKYQELLGKSCRNREHTYAIV